MSIQRHLANLSSQLQTKPYINELNIVLKELKINNKDIATKSTVVIMVPSLITLNILAEHSVVWCFYF